MTWTILFGVAIYVAGCLTGLLVIGLMRAASQEPREWTDGN